MYCKQLCLNSRISIYQHLGWGARVSFSISEIVSFYWLKRAWPHSLTFISIPSNNNLSCVAFLFSARKCFQGLTFTAEKQASQPLLMSCMCWPSIYCSVTHLFKCSGQFLWQHAQTGDEIRAEVVALRESLSICLLTPPFSLRMEEAAREAEHKQQRWLTFAASPRG